MPSQSAGMPSPSQPLRRSTRSRSRVEQAEAVAQAQGSSVAATARARGISRRTLRGWLHRKVALAEAPGASTFAQSPEGTRALHRIVLAAIVVFGVMHGAGAGTLRLFFRFAGLSDTIACSESTLRRVQARVVEAIGSWGDATLQRLGRTQSPRAVTLVLDETWKRAMILVAMDAASGFLLTEKHSASRTGAAWKEALQATFKHLKVRVLQVVADEAQGISNYVRGLLGAHRASDLFHGLHDLGTAVGALHRKRSAAQAAVSKAPGASKTTARALVRRLDARIEVVTGCLRAVSEAFHPFDLATGRARHPEALRARMEQAMARVAHAAITSGGSPKVVARIEKAQRLIPAWCATLTWWQGLVAQTLAAENLSASLREVMHEMVIPLRYLESVRARASQASERRRVDDALATLRARVASASVWTFQPAAVRARLDAMAAGLASHFVRASSGVEGRNGFLSLRYHHRRALPPALLKALTVVHNYVLRREDGTTAAERFFGASHDDLFEHLVATITPLPQPRRRRA